MSTECSIIHTVYIFNFNLFCVRLIHRGYDPSDMELVNTENKVINIYSYDVRYNIINFRIQLSILYRLCISGRSGTAEDERVARSGMHSTIAL
jgi:hypothetical protein